ncbi:MAG: hypothetical protein AB7S26_16915 [Sandaracinaceae bacterium]
MRRTRSVAHAALGLMLLTGVFDPWWSIAEAQTADAVHQALAELSYEPEVGDTARRALEYFRVHPGALDSMRSAARTRSLLPVISGSYGYTLNRDENFSEQMITSPNRIDANSAGNTHGVNVGILWDLRNLAFNPAEVQVYGLVAVQRDLLLEITRTYYLRRQLQIRLRLRPPDDPLAYASLELRVLEFTATLDVLTDGWFTAESERRRERVGAR